MQNLLQFVALLLWWVSRNSHASAQIINGFTLIKTPSTDMGPVLDTVDLATAGHLLSIRADTNSNSVAKVEFSFDGKKVRVERTAPYALGGDTNGIYASFASMTVAGLHTLVAKALDSTGNVLETKSIKFTVKNPTSPVASPIRVQAPVPRPVSSNTTPNSAPVSAPTGISETVQVLGELRKWHKVTLAFTGPFVSETDTINPFMQYRMDVTFTHATSGKEYKVPGYFAADGNAAITSASNGNKWHCNFAPDEIGIWTYVASFVEGSEISVSTSAGVPTSFHGQSGSFNIESTNKSGRDHRGKGRLMYVGQHHLQYAETGEWFLMAGADR
jgi:Domain of unknown function (DUF5060)